uniref:Uncharacterized protein n=1 Tax=Caenorhabditis tropicalis TaxID=1561998 RepID=A0A1I7UID1_9PELO
MLCNRQIIVLSTLLISVINAGSIKVELGTPTDQCGKYTSAGLEYLEITHVRVMDSIHDYNLQHSQKLVNHTIGPNQEQGPFMIVGVRAKKQMLSGPIDYRYNEQVMRMVENNFLNASTLATEKFVHNRHIHVKDIQLNNVMGYSGYDPVQCGNVMFCFLRDSSPITVYI